MRVLGLPVTVHGIEHVPTHGGLLVVCNHQSHLDPVVLLASLPRAVSIVAKAELFEIPIFGRGLRAVGFVPIEREHPRRAVTTMNNAAEICRDGVALLVFPEGTRSEDGALQAFKRGASQLAIKAGVPVLPIAITGTRDVLPAHSLCFMPQSVRVDIGAPISTAGLGNADRTALTQQICDAVAEQYARARSSVTEN